MSNDDLEKNDQARSRSDRDRPGEWPGSGTTVDGKVDSATTGISGGTQGAPDRGQASTSGHTIEPEDVPADKANP
jgi:hypothetical protein